MTDVMKHIYNKIVRRHPHVFGDVKLDGVEGVLQNWEKLKENERKTKKEDKGMLDGVPAALPALNQAQEYQDRAKNTKSVLIGRRLTMCLIKSAKRSKKSKRLRTPSS